MLVLNKRMSKTSSK